MSHGKVTASSFRAPWWLKNCHAQTLWPRFHAPAPLSFYKKERLELPDGDFVDLCWTPGESGPLVAVFHGLEGSIDSPYASTIMSAIHKRGWRGVFMHFRGCSGEFNRLDRNYHSGDTGDIAFLLSTLEQRHPGTPVAAIAYSLGGNALLKYLGENAGDCTLSSAVAVSVPFQLDLCARRLEQGFSRCYQAYLLKSLRDKTRNKYRDRETLLPLKELDTLTTFHLFDDRITAPLHGFKNVDDYYSRSSCRQFLARITTPTLILQSRDDPFMTADGIPAASELGPGIELELASRGGHVGFINGKYPWSAQHWLPHRIPEYLQRYLS